ncbi:MAG: hypothetical protein IKY89_01825, partial [Alistipes sp.]|nr:hypothetical protein [Alistipes sp.]
TLLRTLLLRVTSQLRLRLAYSLLRRSNSTNILGVGDWFSLHSLNNGRLDVILSVTKNLLKADQRQRIEVAVVNAIAMTLKASKTAKNGQKRGQKKLKK